METKKTFFDAIKTGDMEKVNEVLDQDSGLLQARTETGITPILLAMFYGHRDVGEQLVERSASLDIFEASAVGNEACSRELLDNQPELANAWTPDGFQPLGLASFFGNTQVARLLLSNGAEVNSPSNNNMHVMPLHSAAAGMHLEIARELLEHGADPNARQQDGFTPLQEAAHNGQEEMVRLLLEYGAEPTVASEDGRTALDYAKENGNQKVVELLQSSIA